MEASHCRIPQWYCATVLCRVYWSENIQAFWVHNSRSTFTSKQLTTSCNVCIQNSSLHRWERTFFITIQCYGKQGERYVQNTHLCKHTAMTSYISSPQKYICDWYWKMFDSLGFSVKEHTAYVRMVVMWSIIESLILII